jgi:hypothetical protein
MTVSQFLFNFKTLYVFRKVMKQPISKLVKFAVCMCVCVSVCVFVSVCVRARARAIHVLMKLVH